jgi:hypothetical protein
MFVEIFYAGEYQFVEFEFLKLIKIMKCNPTEQQIYAHRKLCQTLWA